MQTFQRAAAVFCIACIAAELITLLVGSVRAARCIKAAAGLYILAVLLSLLPGIPKTVTAALPDAAVVPSSSAQWELSEAHILSRAAEQLETLCITQCRAQYGVEIQADIVLETTGQQAAVTRAVITFPAGCDAATQKAVLDFLQQELGTAPTAAEETTS